MRRISFHLFIYLFILGQCTLINISVTVVHWQDVILGTLNHTAI